MLCKIEISSFNLWIYMYEKVVWIRYIGHGVMLQFSDVTDVKELKSSFAHTVNCTCT